MIFLTRLKFTALAVIAFVILLTSCEQDPITIGAGVVGNEPFTTDRAVFDVFATSKKIRAVRTNKLTTYQLGVIDHPIYGKTEATVTSQVTLSSVNPTFGDASQANETTPENEVIDSVILYIPFLTSPSGDRDDDDVIDSLDEDPLDPNSDTDGDGLTDNQEKSRGSDPLVPDNVDDETFVRDQFSRIVDVDSIYGNRNLPFTLRLQRSTFFLRDLDPNTNFQEAQEYYSDQDFSSFLTEPIPLVEESVTISEMEILLPEIDDDSTEDIDESTTQFRRVNAGIRVALDPKFFQENILDKEGSTELLTQANFNEFLRGINFSIEPAAGQDLYMLFNLINANITISYSYTAEGEAKNKDFVLNFLTRQIGAQGQAGPIQGNAVNSFADDDYPIDITDGIASEENAERLYLKGGAGSFAEINLFDTANGREAISQIKANNWIINEANLVFYVDATPGVIEPPRLYLYNMETDLPLISLRSDAQAEQGLSRLRSYPFYGGLLEGTGAELKYSIKITDYINDLVVRNVENATLGLTITPNIEIFNVAEAVLDNDTETELPLAATLSPLGTILFGSNVSGANAGKKLQLEIFYTEAN